MKPLNEITIAEARKLLDEGVATSKELTQACLTQIQSLDGALHAFLEVYADDALAAADQSDQRRTDGNVLSKLDGIPVAIKDNMLLQGKACTAGSKILQGHIAAYNSTAVRKLMEAGAVILGRTNMDEFAMGSSTEHSAYGPTKHPRDPERVPGGSSGGSAVAVAANMCLGALGSDTGGSIRQPASMCGIFGLKPTYGRVSRYGLMAMASSLDQIGPMTKCVEDAAIILDTIQGQDPSDQTTSDTEPFRISKLESRSSNDLKGLKIGLPKQAWQAGGIESRVLENTKAALAELEKAGAEMVEIDLPYADEALAVYYILMPCEVSANLARFDGMRYGLRKQGLPLFETYAQSRAEGFGDEVMRRILLGTFALSSGYIDAYYVCAKKVQALIRQAYERAFNEVDLIVTPTCPATAFRLGEKLNDPLAMYLEDVFTVSVNVAGVPAISMPCQEDGGMPVGLQLIGKWFDEATVLSAAKVLESELAKQ
ncbi:MAG: Asp-tRNA(Asn)/Glu-tRNA(Gln) amidotransferase subunit GatA [Patescibacteria group bacterium]|nr:Asp-tRNA(Asn)/Glu-tRNA(Gln) amidotransferase subunit GatA [Patescibacteria group bacterium]